MARGRRSGPVRATGAGRRVSRRGLLRAGGGVAVVSVLGASWRGALAESFVDEALDALLAGRAVAESARVRLDLPAQFDYGNTVPLAVAVDSPMTATDYVRRVSVFTTGNPFPEVASLHFSPDSGSASASTRIRLNQGEQEVVAVAESSDGSAWLARRTIEVAISGCGVETDVEVGYAMPEPLPRVKAPARARRDEIIEIRTMISHWMETGLRIDTAGQPIPRRIINRVVCSVDATPIFAAELSPAIAANAYLGFNVVARESTVLDVAWQEDGGAVYRVSQALTVT